MKKEDMDTRQIICSILFASMGLIINYFGIKSTAAA
jgi:hypothetical protein